MEKQFTTPVSMKVPSEEAFKNDLEAHLKEMGYNIIDFGSTEILPYLVTHYLDRTLNATNVAEHAKEHFNRYFIEPYNPKLFLALAGMTNSPDGNVGEWWKYTGMSFEKITNGKMYQQITSGQIFRILNNFNESHVIVDLRKDFIKATKEEIISFFSETETEVEQELIGYRFRNEDFNKMTYSIMFKNNDILIYPLNRRSNYHITPTSPTCKKLKELNLLETFCEPVYAQRETPISYEEAIEKLNENSKVKYTKVK